MPEAYDTITPFAYRGDNRLKAPLATGMLGLELALIQPTLAL
jgi:hypothetical protein